MKRWLAIGGLLVAVVVIWPKAREIFEMKQHAREMKNLETEVMRIELAGHRYDVPIRYMYAKTVERHRRWPKAKPERVKVELLSISVLLPDMRPYYPEDDARWKVLGHGERAEVEIAPSPKVNWFPNLLHFYQIGHESEGIKRKPDKYGLTLDSKSRIDRYLPADDQVELVISCDSESWGLPSSSCNVLTNFHRGIELEYYYGANYLPQWKEIDDGLKALLDQFAQAAQSGSDKEE